jgi:DUF917 family protein
VKGQLSSVAKLVRQASVLAGGSVEVARNPVPAAYVKTHGAPGALRQAMELGRAVLECQGRGGRAMAEAAARALGGEIVMVGTVVEKRLDLSGGFGVGHVTVKGQNAAAYELVVWNEYMTLEQGGQRLATFPDLISTLSLESGLAVGTGAIKVGDRVAVLSAPKGRLILGAGMRDPALFEDVEMAIGKALVSYAFASAA